MLSDLIDRLFNRSSPKSRSEVKRRLQKLLAHDRTTLSPKELEDIQREIMEVVSRYVELDQEGLEFVLASDQRLTSLVANLPIRRIKGDGKDDAARRVVEMPPDESGDEPVPDNMTLDDSETGEGAIANAGAPKTDAKKMGSQQPNAQNSAPQRPNSSTSNSSTSNSSTSNSPMPNSPMPNAPANSTPADESGTEDDDIFRLELEPDPVSASDSQG